MVRVGILRESNELAPKRQNWVCSAEIGSGDLARLPKNEKQA